MIPLNFFRLKVQDFDSFFVFWSLVEKSIVSLRILQCGYSFLLVTEIPDSLSGLVHNFLCGGKDMASG
jgi:hypothetical protein